ncbi:MAG: carbon-nitrogen hydrolase family protein [Victivallales bacterium]|nr:carbon-nitrogen hydrolase family protein [Victivallales bacterium]
MSRYLDVAGVSFQCSEQKLFSPEMVWGQVDEAERRLAGTGIDLVVFCEGVESRAQKMEEAETVTQSPAPFLDRFRSLAQNCQCLVAADLKLREGGRIYNALVYIDKDGTVLGDYRKTYPTPREIAMGITPGKGATIVQTPCGTIGGAICYDINFDDLRDQYCELAPNILCYASMCNGGQICNNWAFRTGAYLITAVKDGLSRIINPLGQTIASACFYERIVRTRINLDCLLMHSDDNLSKMPDVLRKYGKKVLLQSDPDLGYLLLSSEDPTLAIPDVQRDFELKPFRTLLKESAALCQQHRP